MIVVREALQLSQQKFKLINIAMTAGKAEQKRHLNLKNLLNQTMKYKCILKNITLLLGT